MSNGGLFLGTIPKLPSGVDGFYVHLGSAVHQTVALLGYADSTQPGGIKCVGTGFFVLYDTGAYLVTARHVAEAFLHETPFVIRLNRRSGNAELLGLDYIQWQFPADPLVDLAAIPCEIPSDAGFDVQYIKPQELLTPEDIVRLQIDIGDECHTVGLFKFLYGNQRSFPLAHGGHIALMPPAGERIPVWNKLRGGTEYIEGILIESGALDGASGSPVMTRASFAISSPQIKDEKTGENRTPMFVEHRVRLLGLYQGAWFLPPDATLAEGAKVPKGDIVPVGVGVVVPSWKILEFFEEPPLKKLRESRRPAYAARQLSASQDSEASPRASDENPNAREDFNSLLGAAARKRPQDD